MSIKHRGGFTLIELIVSMVIASLIFLILALLFSKSMSFFYRNTIRQQMGNDLRQTFDTMTTLVRKGVPSSVAICSCGPNTCTTTCVPPTGTPPNSRLEFTSSGGPRYAFYWAEGQTWLRSRNAGFSSWNEPQRLAANTTSLIFGGDSSDPAIVWVTLRLDKAVDNSQTESAYVSNQRLRMVTSR